jgi:signal transduction histidine kinase
MEIAKAHGGSVAVSDRSPHGTRFDLQFRPV